MHELIHHFYLINFELIKLCKVFTLSKPILYLTIIVRKAAMKVQHHELFEVLVSSWHANYIRI